MNSRRLSISSNSSTATVTALNWAEMDSKYKHLSDDSRANAGEDQPFEKYHILQNTDIHSVKSTWKHLRPLLIVLVTLIGFFLLAFILLLNLQDTKDRSRFPMPNFPTETVYFQNYSEFYDPPTDENNALWMSLLGPGMGFVGIEHSSQFDLPPGIVHLNLPPDTQMYGISMYHQLHCLMMIRDVYWSLARKEINLTSEEFEAKVSHTNHCFDYIRQGIMCSGDMSIEGKASDLDIHGTQHVNGMYQKHQCKSFDASRAWMDARQESNLIRQHRE